MSRNKVENGKRVPVEYNGRTFTGAVNTIDGTRYLAVREADRIMEPGPIKVEGEPFTVLFQSGETRGFLLYSLTAA